MCSSDLGADTLAGGAGNDTYSLANGYGADTIQENDATSGNTDVARFLAGTSKDQVWFRQVGNDLEASIIGTADKFTVQNWYSGSQYHVEQFKTTDDNKTLLDSQVAALVSAMSASGVTMPAFGTTSLAQPAYNSVLSAIAANWQ